MANHHDGSGPGPQRGLRLDLIGEQQTPTMLGDMTIHDTCPTPEFFPTMGNHDIQQCKSFWATNVAGGAGAGTAPAAPAAPGGPVFFPAMQDLLPPPAVPLPLEPPLTPSDQKQLLLKLLGCGCGQDAALGDSDRPRWWSMSEEAAAGDAAEKPHIIPNNAQSKGSGDASRLGPPGVWHATGTAESKGQRQKKSAPSAAAGSKAGKAAGKGEEQHLLMRQKHLLRELLTAGRDCQAAPDDAAEKPHIIPNNAQSKGSGGASRPSPTFRGGPVGSAAPRTRPGQRVMPIGADPKAFLGGRPRSLEQCIGAYPKACQERPGASRRT